MKILITGGAGFIASHIQDAYIAAGHEVAVMDNLVTGTRKNLHPKTKFFEMDITSPEVKTVFENFKPDIVNHHAAQIDVRKSVEDPTFDAKVNVLGVVNLLEASRRSKIRKFILASTGGAIYGEQDYFPADEKHPIHPLSSYGLNKWVGEESIKLFDRLYSLPFTVLRYANVYGPRQNPHGEAGVVAIFCKKLLKGEIALIHGDGGQTRDYVFVGDVVNANLKALEENVRGIYNIGTAIETNVNELFHILGKFADHEKVNHGPPKLGEQRRSVISSELAKKVLGWQPKVSLEEGLRKTYEWFKENT